LETRTVKYVEQEVAPILEDGTDYGADGKVLVRVGRVRLVWRKGRHYYSGVLNPNAYAAADLCVIPDPEGVHWAKRSGKEVFCGGRLSLRRLRIHIGKIRELLGLSVSELDADQIDMKRTLVIG